MKTFTFSRVFLSTLLCAAMLTAAATASAASTCPFDTGGSDALNDGVVLTRYALGITGAPMTASTRYASLDPLQVKNNIECVGCALDMNGDGMIDAVDTTIIARHLAGFQGASLTAGLALGAGSRNSTAAVTSFLVSGCAVGGAINAFVQDGNAFGVPGVIGTIDAQSLTIKSGGALYEISNGGASTRTVLPTSFFTRAGYAWSTVTDTNARIAGSAGVEQGSYFNISTGAGSTVSGGGSQGSTCDNPFDLTRTHPCLNNATENFATIGGGSANHILTGVPRGTTTSGEYGTIAGGYGNYVYGPYGTIAGGFGNIATGNASFVGGGYRNQALGTDSTVAGGNLNTADGLGAMVAGGVRNTVVGFASFGAGQGVNVTHNSAFVWSGEIAGPTNSSGNGTFTVRAPGGMFFYPGTVAGGCTLTVGSSGWQCSSDRTLKTNISSLNVSDVLKRVVAMPVTSWSFIGAEAYQHVGPMAQDFARAFGLGEGDKTISAMDSSGVALAAIQGLNKKVTAQGSVIRAKDSEIAKLKARLAAIEKKLGL